MENTNTQNPLENPQQKRIIDEIIAQNAHKDGATMVVLNQVQQEIGFISKPMQAYIAQALGAWCCILLLFLYH